MDKKKDERLPEEKDPLLGVPADANTEKHIDFLDIEDPIDETGLRDREDKQTKERQKEWKEGLEEGEKEERQR